MSVGLLCPQCDVLAELGVTQCGACGAALGWGQARPSSQESSREARTEEKISMRNCPTCASPQAADNKFCGSCGGKMDLAPAPEAAAPAGPSTAGKTMFFSNVQMPARAKLILVKGDSGDGVSYQLNGTEHVVGREEGAILFPDDNLVSPRHANFVYRDTKLFVRDEGSTNGVFMRIRTPVTVDSGGVFLVGEQLLQIELFIRRTLCVSQQLVCFF